MTDMWTQRYDIPNYLFGTQPSDFLREAAAMIPPTDALCVADGEGRHSVYLAQQGFTVTAFDPAAPAVAKARALATTKGVLVQTHLASLDDWDWSQTYGVVAALFIQFQGPHERLLTFERLRQATLAGGYVILQGFAPRQVGYGTGGPPFAENMYTADFLRAQFSGWTLHHLSDHDTEVRSGDAHRGTAAVVELVAQKPA